MTNPTVSIIIPTKGRANFLKDLIESIRASTPSGVYELVIVSSDAEDSEKVQWMRDQKDIQLILSDSKNTKRRKSLYYYTNLGVKKAVNQWILVVNDDMVFEKDWYAYFSQTVLNPVNGNAGMVIASSHLGDVSFGSRVVIVGSTKKPGEEWKDLYLADVSFIRRDVMKMIGYFDEKLDWFGSGLDNALALEFQTEFTTVVNENICITHFIADENRASSRGNGYFDFIYLKRKWDNWCKRNNCAYKADLSIGSYPALKKLLYFFHLLKQSFRKESVSS